MVFWAKDSRGRLIAKDISNISEDATVQITGLGSATEPSTVLRTYLQNTPGAANAWPTYPTSIIDTLAPLISQGRLGGWALVPVQTNSFAVVLETPNTSRIQFDHATGQIDKSTPGEVIAPLNLNHVNTFAGGFWGAVQTGFAGITFPTVAQWLTNTAPAYTFSSNTAPITVNTGFGPLRYLGFGYGTSCI